MGNIIPSQQFLVGHRVRVSEEARGEHWPDVGHWITEARYDPQERQVLYSLSLSWPPSRREDIQEGYYESDLPLWAD
jgi:hypothetical protein